MQNPFSGKKGSAPPKNLSSKTDFIGFGNQVFLEGTGTFFEEKEGSRIVLYQKRKDITMNYLVGTLVLDSKTNQRVRITFSDGKQIEAVYEDTYGYNHSFYTDEGREIRLSNHFMHLKGIKIEKI